MRRCEHHTSHRVGAVQGSDRAGRVGRFRIDRFPACNFPGRWRIHHQEEGRLQPRRNQGAEVHQRNTQSTRLFHVCEAFSCRWHNYKPSRWNAPQRRLFRPCSRFVEQQAIQRHHGHGRKIFIRCTRISQGIHLERRSEGTARNKGTHSRNRQLKAHKT